MRPSGNGIADRVRPEFIRSDLAESLERLQTDYVELFLLHRDSRDYPVGEIVDVLHEAKEAGQIGVYGGSNWLGDRVRAANDYAAANGKTPFTVSSRNSASPEMIKPAWEGCTSVSGEGGEADRAFYDENEISLFTWSSLAGGFMTGKFTRDNLDSLPPTWTPILSPPTPMRATFSGSIASLSSPPTEIVPGADLSRLRAQQQPALSRHRGQLGSRASPG